MQNNRVMGLFILILFTVYTKAQNLSKAETIDYIVNKTSYKVVIDSVGNINIDDKVKFNYSTVMLNKNEADLEIRCKLEKGNCIDSKDVGRAVFSYKMKVDKDKLANLYNAFDYLIYLLYKEKPEELTKDPFSPNNYKKNKNT